MNETGDTVTIALGSTVVSPIVDIPRQLGPIRLVEEIGRGGMGVVFRGWDDTLHRDVAVKFLLGRDAWPDSPSMLRFLEGARAAARVKHPNLTTILHADHVAGLPYVVMEYVDGVTLRDVITRHGPLRPAQALVVLDAVCDAVTTLHDNDILHLDLKPSNILLDHFGRPLVTDFGLTISRSTVGTHKDSCTAGTLAYMAPEMFDGVLSPRCDVYAIGITAFELMTCSLPFTGNIELIQRHHALTPLPIDQLARRGVPAAIIEQIERAVHKQPMFRHKSGRQLRATLQLAREMISGLSFAPSDLAQLAKPATSAQAQTHPVTHETGRSGLSTIAAIANRMRMKRGSESHRLNAKRPAGTEPEKVHRLSRLYPELLLFDNYASQSDAIMYVAGTRQILNKLFNRKQFSLHYTILIGLIVVTIFNLTGHISGWLLRNLVLSVAYCAIMALAAAGGIARLWLSPKECRTKLRRLLLNHGRLVCPKCGFDLRTITAPRCPECGAMVENDKYEFLISGETADYAFESEARVCGPSLRFCASRLRLHLTAQGYEHTRLSDGRRLGTDSESLPGTVQLAALRKIDKVEIDDAADTAADCSPPCVPSQPFARQYWFIPTLIGLLFINTLTCALRAREKPTGHRPVAWYPGTQPSEWNTRDEWLKNGRTTPIRVVELSRETPDRVDIFADYGSYRIFERQMMLDEARLAGLWPTNMESADVSSQPAGPSTMPGNKKRIIMK